MANMVGLMTDNVQACLKPTVTRVRLSESIIWVQWLCKSAVELKDLLEETKSLTDNTATAEGLPAPKGKK
jgi:hypothetical protein